MTQIMEFVKFLTDDLQTPHLTYALDLPRLPARIYDYLPVIALQAPLTIIITTILIVLLRTALVSTTTTSTNPTYKKPRTNLLLSSILLTSFRHQNKVIEYHPNLPAAMNSPPKSRNSYRESLSPSSSVSNQSQDLLSINLNASIGDEEEFPSLNLPKYITGTSLTTDREGTSFLLGNSLQKIMPTSPKATKSKPRSTNASPASDYLRLQTVLLSHESNVQTILDAYNSWINSNTTPRSPIGNFKSPSLF